MATESQVKERTPERIIGRYAIYDELASGGMAVVHLGRMLGQAGFSRTVAIKRLHAQFAKSPNFVSMFLDEARLAVRVQHPNVVAPLDVLVVNGEVLLVMEYVAGDTLSRLLRSPAAQESPPSPAIVVSIIAGALHGLHAAHEAVGEDGTPLNIVHRDVSPQNIMVGTNGIARVLDFGVAKAAVRSQYTSNGEVKGKLAYMAPEQLEGGMLDRRTDVFAAGIVAWESLARRRLFLADQPGETMARILSGRIPPASKYSAAVSPQVDRAILRALERDPKRRHQSAQEFALALEQACSPASPIVVGDWVKTVAGDELAAQAERVAAIETKSSSSIIRPLKPPPRISEAVPVRVPAPSFTSEANAMHSQSRITLAMPAEGNAQTAALRTVANPLAPISEHVAVAGRSRFRARLAIVIGASLVLAGGMTAALLSGSFRAGAPAAMASSPRPDTKLPARMAIDDSITASPPEPRTAKSIQAMGVEPGSATMGSSSISAPVDRPPVTAHGSSTAATVTLLQTQHSTKEPTASTKGRSKPVRIREPAKAGNSVNCSPPYVVDSKGIRRLRPECI